ncbi:MAG TPA: HNH/ENDO VII family nuclease [Ignavibacteriaceae bacterium]|nr:HNH/ENDO VII family nuclease [Ignavibacteriaceae bacterium]
MIEVLAKEMPKFQDKLKDLSNESTVKELGEVKIPINPLEYSLGTIENQSLESLKIENKCTAESKETTQKESSLSDEEKQKIKDETGQSDEIIESINSMKEFEIYKKAELQEVEINGRKCLVKSDIDWEQKDSMARTNQERAEAGLSPINKNGETIELHHIGQKNDGPLAELTPYEHRSKENYSVLHDTTKESEIDRNEFSNERSEHWKSRANKGGDNV